MKQFKVLFAAALFCVVSVALFSCAGSTPEAAPEVAPEAAPAPAPEVAPAPVAVDSTAATTTTEGGH